MKWLIEKDISSVQDKLIEAIKNAGHDYEVTDYIPFDDVSYIKLQPHNTIFYGSLNLADKLRRREDLMRGTFCRLESFECVRYYPYLRNYLLNGSGYIILPFVELLSQKDRIFSIFSDGVFIRPSSGKKPFTGQVTYKDTFEKDVDFMGFYDVEPHTLCILAPPKKIEREFRFFVIRDRVITGCEYNVNGKHVETPIWHSHPAAQFAQGAAELITESGIQPEEAYVLDVALTAKGTYRILELNSFSASGIYACDTDAIVREMSSLMEEI